MKFLGGTCENIYGETLDYEIIQHENNLLTECRLKRRIFHFKKWILLTITLTYFAALIDAHKIDSQILIYLSILLFIGVLIKAYLKVKRGKKNELCKDFKMNKQSFRNCHYWKESWLTINDNVCHRT